MLENALFGLLGAFVAYAVMRARLTRIKKEREWFRDRLIEARDEESVRWEWDQYAKDDMRSVSKRRHHKVCR